MGGLIDGGNTMLFLSMIDGGNTMLLHLTGQWWEGTLATRLVSSSLGWSTVWLVRCDGKSAGTGGLINGGNMMLFLCIINGGHTTHFTWLVNGEREGTLAMRLV